MGYVVVIVKYCCFCVFFQHIWIFLRFVVYLNLPKGFKPSEGWSDFCLGLGHFLNHRFAQILRIIYVVVHKYICLCELRQTYP